MNVKLVKARMNKGLSIRSAALAIGICRTTLSRAERGESIHPGTAKLIAEFYDYKQVTSLFPVEEPNGSTAAAA